MGSLHALKSTRLSTAVLLVGLSCCTSTPAQEPASSGEPAATHDIPTTSDSGGVAATPSAAPSASETGKGAGMAKLDAVESEVRATIPAGAGDYARAVALAKLYKSGDISYAELESAVLAMKLPPHKLGDGYLMMTPPPPPPGVTFDPKMMPEDWEGNWGVVAQAYHLGELTKEDYDKLHRAAHPKCKM